MIRMQKMLLSLVGWGAKCGLKFNPEKTVAVLFTRKRKTPTNFVEFEGVKLPYSETVRYLGVDLDSKLHWRQHILNKIKSSKRLLMNIACITNKSFGPCPKIMRWAFTGIVRPALTYGALVWSHELNNQHIKDCMRKLNRLALNLCLSLIHI